MIHVRNIVFRVMVLAVALQVNCVCLAQTKQWTKEEQAVKTAFLFNFARFTYFKDKEADIRVCVAGANPFGKYIKSINGKKLGDRKVILDLNESTSPSDYQSCNILFITSAIKDSMDEFIKISRDKSILTVGELKEFHDKGGIINFMLVGKKVKFAIHTGNLEKAGLRLSSKLLQVAKVVD